MSIEACPLLGPATWAPLNDCKDCPDEVRTEIKRQAKEHDRGSVKDAAGVTWIWERTKA